MNTFLKIIRDIVIAIVVLLVVYIIAFSTFGTVKELKPQEVIEYEECLVNQKINPDDYICVKPKSLMGDLKWQE